MDKLHAGHLGAGDNSIDKVSTINRKSDHPLRSRTNKDRVANMNTMTKIEEESIAASGFVRLAPTDTAIQVYAEGEDTQCSKDKKDENARKNMLLIYVRELPPVDQEIPFIECQAEVLEGIDLELLDKLTPGSAIDAAELGLPYNVTNNMIPGAGFFEVTCLELTKIRPTCKLQSKVLMAKICSASTK